MKKVLLSLAACVIAVTTFAQVDEVTLTVIGTGVDEEKATLQALRSAIEQSFGTFVSANTTILNDKLVQDEIVSVSNGNVKDYKKLAVAALPNGQVSVSVQATVSINKLISYAKSKGSQAEFAGQAFAANVKLMKLRSESATKTYELMVQQLERLAKDMFDFELMVQSSPCLEGNRYRFDAEINVYANAASSNFYKLLCSTINSLRLSNEESLEFQKSRIPVSSSKINMLGSQGYLSQMPIDETKLEFLTTRIDNAIRAALYRYSIQEIGNPSNRYVWSHTDNDWYKLNSMLYKTTVVTVKYKQLLDFQKFALEEKRTNVELTAKQKKELQKGTYSGTTYQINYGPQNLLWNFTKDRSLHVYVDQNQIANCRGFELVGVSAPTNKAL